MRCFSGSANSLRKHSDEAQICSAPLYFTTQHEVGVFITVMGAAQEGSEGNFLNFSSFQEINLYGKETDPNNLPLKRNIRWLDMKSVGNQRKPQRDQNKAGCAEAESHMRYIPQGLPLQGVPNLEGITNLWCSTDFDREKMDVIIE